MTTLGRVSGAPLYQLLGYAGLAPFVACAAMLILGDAPEIRSRVLEAMLSYAAVVATFIGAVHWGLWLADDPSSHPARLWWGVTPSLVSWGLLLLPPSWALLGFITLYPVMAAADLRLLPVDHPGYRGLRRNLSIGVLSCLLLATPYALDLAG